MEYMNAFVFPVLNLQLTCHILPINNFFVQSL